MVFSSLLFLLAFLPLNLLCYYFAGSIKVRNAIMLVFSLVFYAWGEPVYVLILIGMSLFSWIFSRLIEGSKGVAVKRLWLFLAAAVCVGSIGFFKYAGFIAENVNAIARAALLPVPKIALPIGISFYTFQLLTYVVDVYRGEVPAQRSFFRVLLYAGLFHQCVAGPIVRYGDIAKELEDRKITLEDVSGGLTRFIFGLAKKALLANACGAVVDTLLLSDAAIGDAALLRDNLALLEGRSALTLFAGMAFFMLQIYLDFSAYSDMAIGMGRMCGFHYKENFNYPYVSVSVTDFWRRWHMSLGTFFRDYVYIPLGGNRKGKARQVLNLFVVWFLTGLWHGASWNFILWGLYFFVFLVLEKFVWGKTLEKIPVLRRVYLLAIVYFGWVFFKFTDLSMVFTVFKGMFAANGNPWSTSVSVAFLTKYLLFFAVCVVASTPLFKTVGDRLKARANARGGAAFVWGVLNVAVPAALLVLSVLSLVGDSYNPFLYFQF
ncbi:MAG: MBOAT family protein [Clostridia bacterium]|nr:MBOAT family protein [Clostridia bacterium]